MIEKADYHQFSLEDWLHHIQHQHWRTMELKLDRVGAVWSRLQSGKQPFVFTIAGTNGKGSCVAMLDAVLQTAGRKTGSYTSPHLVRYNERVCINGSPVEDQLIIGAFCQIEEVRADIPLTYFEYSTLCALYIFQQQKVDISILETGMGGRLDAINIIDNDLALITSIGLDHEQWLGSDREKIGAEKAGIIKPKGRAACAALNAPKSIANHATNINALLLQGGESYHIQQNQDDGTYTWSSTHRAIEEPWRLILGLVPPLSGQHQSQNLGGVIAALALTAEQTGVTVAHLFEGLPNTQLAARCQIINQTPLTIIDVAHNEDSAKELGQFLENNPVNGKTYAVFGVLEDKALSTILMPLAEQIDHWYLATLTGERGQTSERLAAKMQQTLPKSEVLEYTDPVSAYNATKQAAKKDDRVVIFGSFYTVGDIIGALESD